MVADQVMFVIGVDTHEAFHAFAVIEARSQRLIETVSLPATREGYRQARSLARRRAPGPRVWAIEGTGSYGAGLAGTLQRAGEHVVEVERPGRTIGEGRSARLKTDQLDAERAARRVLAGTAGTAPRSPSQTQALGVLVSTREGGVGDRTRAINELKAALRTGPADLRDRLRGLTHIRLLEACGRLRTTGDPERDATIVVLKTLATRIRLLRLEADTLEREISQRVQELAPGLLARQGIGPISAAQILVGWSHPGRIRNEAAFARLSGTAPIPATSGTTIRHRLDRGGDRRLNRALHTIALTLARIDPATQTYIARRTSEGKTRREATRALKRYLARSIYRQLQREGRTATTTA